MILKIGNGSEWSYVDGISSVNVKNAVKDKPYPVAPEVYFVPSKDGGEVSISKEITVRKTNDSGFDDKPFLITAPFIYLLSDEGKTIERIN